MKSLENDLNLVSLIEEYTYFYLKKKYKIYCRENSIKHIEKENLKDAVEQLFKNEFEDCKTFVLEKINQEYQLNQSNKIEIEDIFIDIKEDSNDVILKITDIIDEFQIKKGYYN